MFKKFSRSEDVGSYSKVKSSEQRKIRKCISEQYPNEDASFDIVFKKKSPMNLANHNHVQLIACENNQVWFFSFRKMEYVPTLRTLHKFPQMLPIVQLDRGAIKFILGGANIMCPGLTSAGGRMESALEEGDICAIYAEGKENALAIGQMKMSTERIRAENRGIGVEVLHILNDDSLEIELGTENVVEIVDNNVASIQHPGQKTYRFDFDYVFGGKTRQEEIFERTAAPMIEEILQGYNSTVFVYGQTGSGKTFTMQGNAGNQGLIPRTVDRLFQLIMSCTDQVEFTIKVSYLEIYLEKIRDLLDITRENLRIRESPSGMWVEGATETYVSSSSELLGLMTDGIANRVFSSTRMNLESSRSHAIFVIAVHQLDRVTKSKKHAKLLLVDLAGSEKVEKTEAWGTALKEAQNINKSLSALGNVINALTTNSSHVPYRDSKLTKLLTDSLGGNSLCCLIICCSPSLYNAVETITTCRFGQRAKLIQNKAKINQERSLPEYKMLLEEAERKIEQQAEIIARLETPLSLNATIPDENLQLSQKQIDGFRTSITNSSGNENKIRPHRISIAAGSALNVMQEKILNLEKELLQNRDESEGLRDQISDKQSEIEMLRESIDDVYNQILMCKVKLDEAEQRNKQSCDENVALQAQILKSNFELEQQKFRAEEAEHDIVSFYDQRRARFEGTDTWTKQFKPNPVVDEHLSETKKIKLITKQYVALFHEFSDQVGKIAELQEANSNLKEEAYAYRQLLEQENIDEDTRQLLSKRAVAENQSAKLVAENFQLKRIEQEQAKLLDSWKSKMAELETALDTMLTLNRKRNDQADSMITELKQEIDAYKAALQHRRDTVNMIAPAHIHKPIVGGIKTERTATVQDVLAEKKSYRPEETVADETKSSNADETKSSNADETKSSNADINDDPFLVEDFED